MLYITQLFPVKRRGELKRKGLTMKFSIGKKLVALAGSIAMLGAFAACGSSESGPKDVSADANAKVTISVWAWEPTLKNVVTKFEKKYPNIKVKLNNVGTNLDAYTALNNAVDAGKGAPDVAQIEYYALPQYAINGTLKDLSSMGAAKYKGFYTPGTWASVHWQNKLYGLPMDSGPMALFYNKAVFDKAGVTKVPTTWEEYYQAAKKIRAVGSYITSDSGDAGFFDSMVWSAGGHPYKTSTDGKTVSISLTKNAGTKEFVKWWQKMIDEGLINTKVKGWTDDWNRGLGDGSIASLMTGAWMPATLVGSAPQATGKWRVAQMPTKDGNTANAENGGSTLSVLSSSDKATAAYKFIEYANHDAEGIKTRVDGGAFPADNNTLKSDSFLSVKTVKNSAGKDIEYFGGQEYNRELAKAASRVLTGYENLPFEVYARKIFADSAGGAYTDKSITLSKGIANWQAKLIEYGKQQGFTMGE